MNINSLREEVNQALHQQVTQYCDELLAIDPQLESIAKSLTDFLSDGKRFRPLFALIGFIGVGGKLDKSILNAAASLEFLQACALIHDDLMDGSDTRRGKPAIHKQFENLIGENSGAKFGAAAAILAGDLALAWNEKALHQSGISDKAQVAVNQIHDEMRTELMAGQFLDIFEQTRKSHSVERALKIARYKSGKYSVERPLHFGAALAESEQFGNFKQIYSEYGLPLGEAFQLRDDLLGVYGDPVKTGKPAGDDLREGKQTALIAFAYDRGNANTKELIDTKLGTDLSAAELSQLQDAIRDSGAITHLEDLIEKLSEEALDAINRDEISELAKPMLVELVSLVTKRAR